MDYSALINQVKNIIISPQKELFRISENIEPKHIIFNKYAIPLILIASFSLFIGSYFFSIEAGNFSFSLARSVVSFLVLTISMFAIIFVMEKLLETFKIPTSKNEIASLIVFSSIPSWVVSTIVGLFPFLGQLSILSIYSYVIFWMGLSILLKVPQEKKVSIFILSILLFFILEIFIDLLGKKIITQFI